MLESANYLIAAYVNDGFESFQQLPSANKRKLICDILNILATENPSWAIELLMWDIQHKTIIQTFIKTLQKHPMSDLAQLFFNEITYKLEDLLNEKFEAAINEKNQLNFFLVKNFKQEGMSHGS